MPSVRNLADSAGRFALEHRPTAQKQSNTPHKAAASRCARFESPFAPRSVYQHRLTLDPANSRATLYQRAALSYSVSMGEGSKELLATAGLCFSCVNARRIESD